MKKSLAHTYLTGTFLRCEFRPSQQQVLICHRGEGGRGDMISYIPCNDGWTVYSIHSSAFNGACW